MANQRRAGSVEIIADGVKQDAKGAFSYNLGEPLREPIIGSDGKIHGWKETPQPGFIEGAITDRHDLDLRALVAGKNLTVVLNLAIGKTIALNDAFFAGEGTVSTEEAEIPVRWIGDAEEIP